MDLRLFSNRTLAVVGPSHSGKTTFVLQLLDHRQEMFDCAPQNLVWCYGIYQHDLNAMLQQRGYITHSDIIAESAIQPYDIIVLDDLIHESRNSKARITSRASSSLLCKISFRWGRKLV